MLAKLLALASIFVWGSSDIEVGQYRIVIVMNLETEANKISPQQDINQLAGKITAFKNVEAVAWQQKTREEWDEARLSS